LNILKFVIALFLVLIFSIVVIWGGSFFLLKGTLQQSCQKIEVIARDELVVEYLKKWASNHVIDKGYNSVFGMNGRITGSKGEEFYTIEPLPEENITGIEINSFRLSVDKISGDFDTKIINSNVGQVAFGRGRDQIIILKNGAQLKKYRGHDESSGHLLKINDTTYAYCANAKFEI